jgi:hypothetical protein
MCSLKVKFLAIGILAALSSCLKSPQKTSAKLYPVDSLIRAQAGMLANAKAMLSKTAEIDGESEQTVGEVMDTLDWMHALDIFTALNTINMPTNVDEYTVEDGLKDKASNLTIRSFSTVKDLPVVYLKVFYHDELQKLRRIEALYHEENALLKGSRHMTLEFQDIYNQPTLTSYVVEGGQEMFLSKNVKFSVRGIITIP